MSTHRFSMGKQFCWKEVLYEVKRMLPEEGIQIEEVATGLPRMVKLQELVEAFFREELFFLGLGKSKATKEEERPAELADYPADLVALAKRRLAIIQPLLAQGVHCTLADVQARVAEIKTTPPEGEKPTLEIAASWRSVYRWRRAYLQSGGDIRALIPATSQRGGKGQSRLEPEVEALVDAIIRANYYKPEKVTIRDLNHLVAAAIEEENRLRPVGERLTVPAEATIFRRIDALDLYERFAAQHGQRTARRQFAQHGQMEYPTRPLERVEMDSTPIDLIVVDERDYLPLGRLNLTKAMDTATRYPLGWYVGFEPPSYYTVMEALYHAICSKPDTKALYGTEHQLQGYGIAAALVVDNGKEFIGQDLEDACLQLGIALEYSPVRTPEFKAAIERHFRTCNGLFHTLPGTTFSNVIQRGDYDSAAQACITQGELERALHIFLVDIYAEQFHQGLQGVPARRWEEATRAGFSPRLPASAQELLILLGRVEYRHVHHYGIDFLNLRYNSADLALLRHRLGGEPAKIKYHPGDLSRLHVYDPFDQVYLSVPALADEYTQGLSLWKHRIVCAYARRHQDRVDLAALGRAKRKIQEIVDTALGHKRRRGGKKLGRWETSGKPPSQTRTEPAAPSAPAKQLPPQDDPEPKSTAPTSPVDEPQWVPQPQEEDWRIRYDLPRSSAWPAPQSSEEADAAE